MSCGLGFALIAGTAAGCSGAPARSTATTARLAVAPSTTGPAAAADTTPPPALLATGHDYAAIGDSLFTYIDWIEAHRPDPALVSEAIQRGTATFETGVALVADLRSNDQTVVSIDKKTTFRVAGVYDSTVMLRVSETLLEDRTVDRHHQLVKTQRYPGTSLYDVLIVRDGTGRWRIADVTTVAAHPSIVITR